MKKITVLALLLGLLAGCGAAKAETALPEDMPADFEIRYENWVDENAKTDGRAAQFYEFVQYMDGLFYDSPEYQSLPETMGGYM